MVVLSGLPPKHREKTQQLPKVKEEKIEDEVMVGIPVFHCYLLNHFSQDVSLKSEEQLKPENKRKEDGKSSSTATSSSGLREITISDYQPVRGLLI